MEYKVYLKDSDTPPKILETNEDLWIGRILRLPPTTCTVIEVNTDKKTATVKINGLENIP